MDNIAKWITKLESHGADVTRRQGLYVITHDGNTYEYDPKSNVVTNNGNTAGTLKFLIKTIIR